MQTEEVLASAITYHQAGDLAEAERLYRSIVAVYPTHPQALRHLGILAGQIGKPMVAVQLLSMAIHAAPREATCYNDLGNALKACGHLEEAKASYQAAIAFEMRYADAHFNLGNVFRLQGNFSGAIASYERAIALSPLEADAHNNLGTAWLELGQPEKAERAFLRAVGLNPQYAEAHFNRGNAFAAKGDHAEAVECFHLSLAVRPHYAKALQNRGTSQEALGDLDAAIGSYREALACEPENQEPKKREVLSNLGQVLAFKGDAQGVAYLEKLVEDTPDSAKAHWNLGLALLLRGEYARGFQEYEWRWKCKDWSPRPFAQPQWKGEPLEGKTILLHAEQGQGDTLQFMRYAPLVAARGARVVVEVQASLVRLLRNHPGVDLCIRQGDRLPEFSCHCPLMSLPMVFGTAIRTVPATVAYRRENGGAPSRRMRVGLVWSGNPEHPRNRLRAVPLTEFSALLRVPGVEFISLQKGEAGDEAGVGPIPFREIERIASAVDFADTARIIASLDLVITVDTAVAHLAGSMGKPVWILISNFPDWRWGLHAETTPWYPTARLFRQQRPRTWDQVMARVTTALEEFAGERNRLVEKSYQHAEGWETQVVRRFGVVAQGG